MFHFQFLSFLSFTSFHVMSPSLTQLCFLLILRCPFSSLFPFIFLILTLCLLSSKLVNGLIPSSLLVSYISVTLLTSQNLSHPFIAFTSNQLICPGLHSLTGLLPLLLTISLLSATMSINHQLYSPHILYLLSTHSTVYVIAFFKY